MHAEASFHFQPPSHQQQQQQQQKVQFFNVEKLFDFILICLFG
jgi:hypothetical protein